MSRTWLSHITHMNGSRHSDERVMSYTWMSRVTLLLRLKIAFDHCLFSSLLLSLPLSRTHTHKHTHTVHCRTMCPLGMSLGTWAKSQQQSQVQIVSSSVYYVKCILFLDFSKIYLHMYIHLTLLSSVYFFKCILYTVKCLSFRQVYIYTVKCRLFRQVDIESNVYCFVIL